MNKTTQKTTNTRKKTFQHKSKHWHNAEKLFGNNKTFKDGEYIVLNARYNVNKPIRTNDELVGNPIKIIKEVMRKVWGRTFQITESDVIKTEYESYDNIVAVYEFPVSKYISLEKRVEFAKELDIMLRKYEINNQSKLVRYHKNKIVDNKS